MAGRKQVVGIVALAAALSIGAAGCGDDGTSGFGGLGAAPEDAPDTDATADSDPEPDPAADAGSGAVLEDPDLIVEVAGTEYVVDTDRGGYCEIDGDTETGSQISAGGFDAASGTRVELALRHQTADTTPSEVDEWFGGLSIASSPVQWMTSSTEPWPFEVADPVSGTVTMEDDNGQIVPVTFRLDCP